MQVRLIPSYSVWASVDLTETVLQVLIPLAFFLVGMSIAVPPLLVHLCFHPFIYFISTEPVSKRLKLVSQKLFFYQWRVLAPLLNKEEMKIKQPLMARAYGTTLEIGAGVGTHLKGYSRSKVTRLILVEPNASMHPSLRENANAAGFTESDGSLLLLGCGGAAADETPLALAGVGSDSVDTIVSIHVLCGIPHHDQAIEMYRRMLHPGGLFLFYEHVRSTFRYSADWQSWYTQVIWPYAFDGCCLDRQTGALIAGGPSAVDKRPLTNGVDMVSPITGWDENVKRRWKEFHIDQPEAQVAYSCLPNVYGWAVKA